MCPLTSLPTGTTSLSKAYVSLSPHKEWFHQWGVSRGDGSMDQDGVRMALRP